MTCKGCITFREKIRVWLGVDDLYIKLGNNLQAYVDENAQITRQVLVDLISACEKSVQKNAADLISLERKFVSVGGKLQEHTREFRLVKDAMRVDSDEVAALAESVQKLEFPGFDKGFFKSAEG